MKMNFFTVFSVSLLSLFLSLCNAQQNTTFQVGVILDANSTNALIGNTSLLLALSDFYSINSNYTTRIVLHPRDSRKQVTTAAADALNLLKDVQVDAIIGPQTSAQANFVIGLGGAAKVPVISFTATSPSLRPQTPYFVQAAINDAAQVDAIAAIVKYFHWYRIIFVYEDSDYGNGIIPYLSNAFQEVNARVSYRSVIPVSANDDFIIEELHKMKKMQTRVFVVHTTTPLASKIFLKAKEAEMMSEGYVWIVTSGLMNLFYSLEDPRIVESMQGVVGVKPFVPRSGKLKSTTTRWQNKFAEINPGITPPPEINLFGLWAYDTLSALAIAAEKVRFREPTYLQNTTALNSTNIFTTGTSQTGPKLLPEILGTEFEGLAGYFKLVNGQLQPSSFQILNVRRKKLRQVGKWTPLLPSSSSQRNANMTGFLGEELDQITWPGKSRNIPKGWEVSVSGEKLKVGVPAVAGFPEFVNTTNATNITGLYIDLFKSVMAALPYAVEYEFARFVKPDGSSAGSYDDLSQKVLYGEYDIVIGDITITANRSEYVDFSIPIEQGGVTRTQKIQYDDKINSELFFLKPLEKELWLTAIALFIFTGLALWILEHRVNKAFRGPASEHVGLIFYIPFMSLVFANRERIVSNLARIVIVVWIFIVLILNSTFTASLSAEFTTAKLEKDHTDVSELIRNNDYVGCRDGSFVYELLKDLGFNESYIRVYKRPEELDEALSKGSEKGGIKAMFSPTPYTNLFLSKYPKKYMKVGSPYLSEGFAFAFPKGSPLVADVSRAIIKLTDNHTISAIKANWTSQFNDDGPSDSSSTHISLRSFTVLFAITGGVTGVCLVVFLVSYLYKNRDFVQRISSSEMTTWSKLRAMSRHFDQRDPNSFRSGEYASSRHQNPVPAEEIQSENEDNVCPNSDRITEEDAHGSSSVQVENSRVTNNTTFRVGVILDADSLVGRIGNTSLSLALSDFYSINSNYSTRIVLHPRDSRKQLTDAADRALNLLKDVQVDAIIGPQTSTQANFVIGLGDAANVPVVSFSATSPSFYPQASYFVQTAINDAAQVDAIAAIVNYFKWSQVVLIYEDSDYGIGITPYLSNAFQQVNARVSYRSVIPISASDDLILQEMYKMKTMQTRVFVVHTSSSLASTIFRKAKEAEMIDEGYVWIVTSGIMNLFYSFDSKVVESMQGVLGVKPLVPISSKLDSTTMKWQNKFKEINPGIIDPPPEITLYGLWAYDTLFALAMAAEKIGFREEPTSLPNTTSLNSADMFITEKSITGPKLRAAMLETEFEGLSGNFKLVDGKLKSSSFQILNINGEVPREVGIWTPLLQSSSDQRNKTQSNVPKLEKIIWPGQPINVPKGWEVPVSGKKLRVGVPAQGGFPEFVNAKTDHQTNSTKISGYYIDLFDSVMAALPYAVRYEYVPYKKPDGSNAGTYNELSRQVANGVYDAVVGDLTITATRSEYVDFTLPIEEGGVTITQNITYAKADVKSFFLKPFTRELWLTSIAILVLTGVALWILEHRFNAAFRGPPSEHVGLILYIPFMSLVFANRERIVSNLARLVLVVWIFVVLILSSTYTASLSASFTTDKLEKQGTNIDTLIKNGDYVGCREGSFIFEFLIGLGFEKKNIKTCKNPREFDEALSNGTIKAMFSRTPYTNLFLSKYCNKYMKVGTPNITDGVGFVFPKGSPLVADVSRAIIKLTDNQKIFRWIRQSTCNEDSQSKDSLTKIRLGSFKILFGITAGITCTCLLVFLVSYFYENRDFIRRVVTNSGTTTWSKLRAISKHFDQRDPKSFRSKDESGNASPDFNAYRDYNVHQDGFSTVTESENGSVSPHSDRAILAAHHQPSS